MCIPLEKKFVCADEKISADLKTQNRFNIFSASGSIFQAMR
jgi:uncharacterized protein (AIM24 family)